MGTGLASSPCLCCALTSSEAPGGTGPGGGGGGVPQGGGVWLLALPPLHVPPPRSPFPLSVPDGRDPAAAQPLPVPGSHLRQLAAPRTRLPGGQSAEGGDSPGAPSPHPSRAHARLSHARAPFHPPAPCLFKLTRKIDNVETSWALGATFHYIDSLSRQKSPTL